MTLDKNKLSGDLLKVMNSASAEAWEPPKVASALADAIDGYVRGGEVKGLTITLPGGQSAAQARSVKLT